ncbi:hypothetical protein TrST_g7848 [Triparma strigata]|uniref:RING-type domain-containing protein n=1 Tax=Triparma strigata TaxID=1606541 RepID=A0A9W7AZT7_9STRA|nr:hypothetical protein TrST_g7848 [Triparma strigata]
MGFLPPVKNVEEVDDKCIICMDRAVNVKFKGCSHSMTCRECTDEMIRRGMPCPLCRKPISGYEVGKFIDSIGAHGLWPTPLKNLTQLASGEIDLTSTSRTCSWGTRRRT